MKCKRYYENNKPKLQEYARAASRSKGSEWHRRKNLMRWYGLSINDYNKMVDACGGLCEICGMPEVNSRKCGLVVDHCHVTGKIRGLLCYRCNISLGSFNDDPELLMKAAAYLLRTGSKISE